MPPYGQIYTHWKNPLLATWMYFTGEYPASHTPKPVNEQAPMIRGIYGQKRSNCFGKYDPDSFSWRMLQASLWEPENKGRMFTEYSTTFVKSGMSSDGLLYELATSAHPIGVNDSSCWPTVTTDLWGTPQAADSWSPPTITEKQLRRGDPNGSLRKKSGTLAKDAPTWGTPMARDAMEGSWHTVPINGYLSRQAPSTVAVNWATPVTGFEAPGMQSTTPSLAHMTFQVTEAMQMDQPLEKWVTAKDYSNRIRQTRKIENNGKELLQNTPVYRLQLNPIFVQGLMGLPLGWTNIDEKVWLH